MAADGTFFNRQKSGSQSVQVVHFTSAFYMHPHRFRHSYAINALRAGMPEQVLKIVGGWKKIPETYFRTLGEEDAREFHRQVSPGDKLGKTTSAGRTWRQGQRRGRL